MNFDTLQFKLDEGMQLSAEENAWLIKNNQGDRKQVVLSQRGWYGWNRYPDSFVDKLED